MDVPWEFFENGESFNARQSSVTGSDLKTFDRNQSNNLFCFNVLMFWWGVGGNVSAGITFKTLFAF